MEAHVAAWLEALERLGRPTPYEAVRPLMGLPAGEIARRLFPERADELARLKVGLFLEKYIERVRPYPDVDALEALPRPIAVVSSSSGVLVRAVLARAGIRAEYALGGDEVPRGKPAPDPLFLLSDISGVAPARMVVVGDSRYDVEMALAAGATPVCIARAAPPCAEGVRAIRSLKELVGPSRRQN